ncbi:MAG: SLC13 family permease [Acidobacteriota bacterium]|jgi:di/tricarboxylate transporter
MTLSGMFVLAVLLATLVALVLEVGGADLISMTAFGLLALVPLPQTSGGWAPVLDQDEALGVFGNPAVVTVAALFILAAGISRTGALDPLHRLFRGGPGTGEAMTVLALAVPVLLLSAFLNNTPVVVLFVPIALRLADERGLAPSRLLIPISFAALLGGMCTLIGTSTNILVHSLAEQHGLRGLGMFELAWIGVPASVLGLGYIVAARKLLPERETASAMIRKARSREYLLEVVINEGSRYAGKGIAATPFAGRPGVHVLELVRGGEERQVPLEQIRLRAHDRMLVLGPASLAKEVRSDPGLRFPVGAADPTGREALVFEGMVGPSSRLVDQTVRSLRFRQRYGAAILAVHRHGRSVEEPIPDVRFRFGDIVLMMGTEASLERLREEPDFLLLEPDQPIPRKRAPLAAAIAVAVIALAAAGLAPISLLAIGGAVAMILTRCLQPREAYEAVQWDLLFLIFGMLALGRAMEVTGAAAVIAEAAIGPARALGPQGVLATVLGMTILVTSILTNNAAVVLMLPLALSAAAGLQGAAGAPVDPRPFLIAVALGGSVSFATPIGYQTNTYVHGVGGYRFRDFLKIGLPLTFAIWALGIWLIPMVWPF